MNFKNFAFSFALLLSVSSLQAQDDLLDLLGSDKPEGTDYVQASFKSSRLVSGHSVETVAARHLDFRIHHRFGTLNSGPYTLWGLDNAVMRLGLEYGITDRLNAGFGRNSNTTTYDGFLKYKLLRQSSGEKNMPVTLTLFSSLAVVGTERVSNGAFEEKFEQRLAYVTQALIARKMSDALTLQVMPTFFHRNLTYSSEEKNSLWAAGIGGRLKLSKRTTFNAEYYLTQPGALPAAAANAFSIGFDIETGGHVFQLHFTNSPYMIESDMLSRNTQKWEKGDIFYGFNISRTFNLGKK